MSLPSKLIEKATDVAAEGIIITDATHPKNPIIYVNQGFVHLTGYEREEILGKNCRFLQGDETDPNMLNEIRQAIREERECLVELINYDKNGRKFWNRLSISPIKDQSGKTSHFVGVQSDITELKETKTRLEQANTELEKFRREMILELEQAKNAQEFILPERLLIFDNIRIASKFVPLVHIGGDFFDVFKINDEKFGMLIADVTGHGIPAALLTFMSSISFKRAAEKQLSTKAVFTKTNELLFGEMPGGAFVSMFYIIYDNKNREITYSQAGHPPAFLLRPKTKEVIRLTNKGTLIGIFKNDYAVYEESKMKMKVGDKVILYTDAIIEAFSEQGEMMEMSRLKDFLAQNINLPIDQLLEAVYNFGIEFSQKKAYNDDATLVGFEILK